MSQDKITKKYPDTPIIQNRVIKNIERKYIVKYFVDEWNPCDSPECGRPLQTFSLTLETFRAPNYF